MTDQNTLITEFKRRMGFIENDHSNAIEFNLLVKIMNSPEYKNLIASIEEPEAVDKADGCSCHHDPADGIYTHASDCALEVEEKKPERQTLLQFMDKRAGYIARQGLTKEASERREVYRNISEYLEREDS